jgi:hypothetical protein
MGLGPESVEIKKPGDCAGLYLLDLHIHDSRLGKLECQLSSGKKRRVWLELREI